MSPIEYIDLYPLGNEQVDREHRKWVDIFNDLEERVLKGNVQNNKASQLETLKDILEFTRDHFGHEERLLAERGYSDIVRHKRMHKEFDNTVYTMYRDVEAGEIILNTELLSLLRNWFLTHTSTEDKRAFEEIQPKTT